MPDIESEHLAVVMSAYARDGEIPPVSQGIINAAYEHVRAHPDKCSDPEFIKKLAERR